MIEKLFEGVKNVECNGNMKVDGVILQTVRLQDLSVDRWNSLAEKQNTKMFIELVGRQPRNYEEVRNWVRSLSTNNKAAAATATL